MKKCLHLGTRVYGNFLKKMDIVIFKFLLIFRVPLFKKIWEENKPGFLKK
jgi:hypothetical protein